MHLQENFTLLYEIIAAFKKLTRNHPSRQLNGNWTKRQKRQQKLRFVAQLICSLVLYNSAYFPIDKALNYYEGIF